MTTKVTIDAHAGWDVKVVTESFSGTVEEKIVQKNTVQDIYVHSGLKIILVEEVKQ